MSARPPHVTVTLTALETFALVCVARAVSEVPGDAETFGLDAAGAAALGRAWIKLTRAAQPAEAGAGASP